MHKRTEREEKQIISYLILRTFIGAIGLLLPIVLVIADSIYHGYFLIQDSISDYYQTCVRNIFVGVLFVLGFFLLSYRGYEKRDNIIASLGFVFAVCVALFPSHHNQAIVEIIHFGSAVLMFLVFVYFSMCLFTKGEEKSLRTKRKNRRNRIYFYCGIAILLFLLCCGLAFITLSEEQRSVYKVIFIFETLSLWAFGISWLTKGRYFWKMFLMGKYF